MTNRNLLERTAEIAGDYLAGVRELRVGSLADYDALLRSMGGPLPSAPQDALEVIESLAEHARPGLVTTPGPRHFGLVIGGALPAALAADWLASAWDQNAFSF